MSLGEQLARLRDTMAKQIPEHVRTMMGEATQDLRDTGIVERAIKVGDPLPPFDLANADGTVVRSQNLLERGAVVLTVFRGHW